MLTQERADKLTNYLNENEAVRNELLTLSPEEAVKRLETAGFDFTAEELIEYGKALKLAVATDEELSADELENVSGGVVTVSIGVAVAWGIGGLIVGFATNFKW